MTLKDFFIGYAVWAAVTVCWLAYLWFRKDGK